MHSVQIVLKLFRTSHECSFKLDACHILYCTLLLKTQHFEMLNVSVLMNTLTASEGTLVIANVLYNLVQEGVG